MTEQNNSSKSEDFLTAHQPSSQQPSSDPSSQPPKTDVSSKQQEAGSESCISQQFKPETTPSSHKSPEDVAEAPEKKASYPSEVKSAIKKSLQEQKQATAAVPYPQPQEVSHPNIIHHVVADHQTARDLYNYYQHTTDIKEKTKTRNVIVRDLIQHDECEQAFMYPLLKDINTDSAKEYYERSLKEHQELRDALYPIRKSNIKKDADFDKKLQEAVVTALAHMVLEETEILPLLQEHCSEKDLEEAGSKYKQYKPMFATRPHPNAPKEGKGLATSNVLIHPFDKLRDFMDGHD